jgi:ribosomal 50S subunit-recycling heat shock protein
VRLDVFLHAVCLLKSRTMAKEACDRGRVTVNGAAAKGSHTVHAGERIRVDLGTRVLDLEVTAVPPGRTSRKDAPAYYRMHPGDVEGMHTGNTEGMHQGSAEGIDEGNDDKERAQS